MKKSARPLEYTSNAPSVKAWRDRGLSRKEYNNLVEQAVTSRDDTVRKILDGLPVQDRKFVVDVLRDLRDSGASGSNSLALQHIWEMDYRWRPVSVETYLDDPYYLGKFTETLFPKWRQELTELFAPGAQYSEWLLGGAIGAGKSFTAAIAMSRLIYQMSCLRNPQRYYGLANKSKIVFGMYSVTKAQASDVGYDKLRMFVENSPYFEEKFQFNRRLLRTIDFASYGMSVRIGSREFHALGADLFAFVMDEANFMQQVGQAAKRFDPQAKGQAEKLYNAVMTRIKSRYLRPGGLVPGMVFLVSSKQDENAFMERRKKEAKVGIAEKTVKISEYSQWEVKDPRMYTRPKFYVEIGDRMYPSRVLESRTMDEAQNECRDGAEILEVPGEFLADFVRDVDQSLRDIAGVATYGIAPLFRERWRITDCVTKEWQHPMTRQEISISDQEPVMIDEFFEPSKLFEIRKSHYVPRIDPHMPRFAHIDIALTNDALGIAIGHVHGIKLTSRVNPQDGMEYTDRLPIVYFDLLLRVIPPQRGEIDLAKARSFLIMLREAGLPITHVSADGTYGRDTCQVMRKAGFESEPVSVDKSDEAYMSLRQSIYDKRVFYYQHDHFIQELSNLEKNLNTGKVDHPPKNADGSIGSKDVADAVAAVNLELSSNPLAFEKMQGSTVPTYDDHDSSKSVRRSDILLRQPDAVRWDAIEAARRR